MRLNAPQYKQQSRSDGYLSRKYDDDDYDVRYIICCGSILSLVHCSPADQSPGTGYLAAGMIIIIYFSNNLIGNLFNSMPDFKEVVLFVILPFSFFVSFPAEF